MKKRLGVLISGNGSNMKALVAAGREPASPFEVAVVVANTSEAGGLAWAKEQGLKTHLINHKYFTTREDFDCNLNDYLQQQNLDLIACAGFMRIMTKHIIAPWAGRMVNIHPSLLPLFKGLNTHARAIADGQKVAGCSVHYVSEELDGGKVITQARVKIIPGDTAETLAARVLVEEHKLYPQVISRLAQRS